jgi:AraC family transcriptional regulator
LRRARRFIEDHYEQSIGLDEMAAEACMSRPNFLRQFKGQFGLPPYRYLLECRLRAAQELLITTDMPVTDVVLAAGFGNRSAFSRLFKERQGISPQEFRMRYPKLKRSA